MTCDDFRAAYLSDELSGSHRQHLAGCSACRDDQPALESAHRLLADSLLWEEPDGQLEEQVVGLISGPATLTATPPTRRRSWRIPVAAAVAGLLVASLGVWALWIKLWKVSSPNTQTVTGVRATTLAFLIPEPVNIAISPITSPACKVAIEWRFSPS